MIEIKALTEEAAYASIPSPARYGSFEEGLNDNDPLTLQDFGGVILRYQIDLIERLHPCIPGIRETKAYELGILYGAEGLAQKILPCKYIASSILNQGINIVDLLIHADIFTSKTEARTAIKANAPRLNGMPITEKIIVDRDFLDEEGYIFLTSSSKQRKYTTKRCVIIERKD